MKNIFIINETGSSFNGVGTGVSEMINIFREISYLRLNVIMFNSFNFEFEIQEKENILYYLMPRFCDYKFVPYSKQIIMLLSFYIKDSIDNIFIVNHGPSLLLIEGIKRQFKLSKTIFVAHNFSWCDRLLGDIENLEIILSNNNSTNQYNDIIESVQEEKKSYNLYDKIICLCQDAYNALLSIYKISSNKICVINNTLKDIKIYSDKEICNFKQNKKISSKKITFIYAARVAKVKGIDVLAKSMIDLLNDGIDCQLIIAGSNNIPEWILNLTKTYPASFIFIGFVNRSELIKWYQSADIGILPSYCEQCSFSGLEMLKLGLPIVSSNGFGMTNMFNNQNSVVAEIERKDPTYYSFQTNLTYSLKKIISSVLLQHDLSINAKKTFEERYNFKNTVKLYDECFKSLFS